MTVRWRLTLYFSLALGVILGLAGIINYVFLQRNLVGQIDGVLKAYSVTIHNMLSQEETLNYDAIYFAMPGLSEFIVPGTYVQVIDRNGYVVAKSDNLGEEELPVSLPLIEKGFAGYDTLRTVAAAGDVRLRIMVSPLYMEGQTLLLEVAQSSNYIDSAMNQARLGIVLSILIALGLSTILGGTVVRGALSPVVKITRTVGRIERGLDLSQRVGYTGPRDEVGQLASTFDHMLERLDNVFKSQKHFVADASHELRSPLTVIRGNLDLLQRDPNEPNRPESLRAIEAETTRMIGVVNNLLLLAEVDSIRSEKPESVALKRVLETELQRAHTLSGGRQLVIRRAEDLVVPGDSQKLGRLLGNLLDNAIRHTLEDDTISVSLFREDGWARLEVEDTGAGIANEHLPHVFDRFYRVNMARIRERGGAGLGLAIVKEIAEQHGGKVMVRSELGVGSTFTVWLKL